MSEVGGKADVTPTGRLCRLMTQSRHSQWFFIGNKLGQVAMFSAEPNESTRPGEVRASWLSFVGTGQSCTVPLPPLPPTSKIISDTAPAESVVWQTMTCWGVVP